LKQRQLLNLRKKEIEIQCSWAAGMDRELVSGTKFVYIPYSSLKYFSIIIQKNDSTSWTAHTNILKQSPYRKADSPLYD
jgi:hypothetical protein